MNDHALTDDRPAPHPIPSRPRRTLLALLAAAALLLPLTLASSASAHPAAPTISRANKQSTSAGAHCVNMAIDLLYPSDRRIGGYAPPSEREWTFSRATAVYVKDLQRLGRLKADGVVGRDTGSLLWFLWDQQFVGASSGGLGSAVGSRSSKWQTVRSGFYDYTCYGVVPSRPVRN